MMGDHVGWGVGEAFPRLRLSGIEVWSCLAVGQLCVLDVLDRAINKALPRTFSFIGANTLTKSERITKFLY